MSFMSCKSCAKTYGYLRPIKLYECITSEQNPPESEHLEHVIDIFKLVLPMHLNRAGRRTGRLTENKKVRAMALLDRQEPFAARVSAFSKLLRDNNYPMTSGLSELVHSPIVAPKESMCGWKMAAVAVCVIAGYAATVWGTFNFMRNK